MEFAIAMLFAWCFGLTLYVLFTGDNRKLDIEFLNDDVRSLQNRLSEVNRRHHKLKDAIREAVTDE